MNYKLSILGLIAFLATACSTFQVNKATDPKERISYPIVVESKASPEKLWTILIDEIAVKGYTGGIDHVNGLFVGTMSPTPYAIEPINGQITDTTAFIMVPRLRYQEVRVKSVESSRLVYPDTVSIVFNVRIRSNHKGGSFINVNIPKIQVIGAHYKKKATATNASLIHVPVGVKPEEWTTAKSTGKLEKSIIEAIQQGNTAVYDSKK